jgi:hypothetical protein
MNDEVEGSPCGLKHAQEYLGLKKTVKFLVEAAGVSTEIRTGPFQNTSPGL